MIADNSGRWNDDLTQEIKLVRNSKDKTPNPYYSAYNSMGLFPRKFDICDFQISQKLQLAPPYNSEYSCIIRPEPK